MRLAEVADSHVAAFGGVKWNKLASEAFPGRAPARLRATWNMFQANGVSHARLGGGEACAHMCCCPAHMLPPCWPHCLPWAIADSTISALLLLPPAALQRDAAAVVERQRQTHMRKAQQYSAGHAQQADSTLPESPAEPLLLADAEAGAAEPSAASAAASPSATASAGCSAQPGALRAAHDGALQQHAPARPPPPRDGPSIMWALEELLLVFPMAAMQAPYSNVSVRRA